MTESTDNAQPHRMDDFVSQIVSDPANPTGAILLSGYLGASSEANHIRLYFDPQLTTYVDIPNADVLHSQPLSEEQSPLGGSYVWIRREAELLPGRVSGQRMRASFFQGAIMQQEMGVTRRPQWAQPSPAGFGYAQMHRLPSQICQPQGVFSPSDACYSQRYDPMVCTSLGAECPFDTVQDCTIIPFCCQAQAQPGLGQMRQRGFAQAPQGWFPSAY